MKNKGFTLIELLAVIVILAIIALIAVPIILNIVGNSKKSSVVRSGELYLKAVETAIARENLNNQFNPTTCVIEKDGNLTCDGDKTLTIEVNGNKPTSGTITLEKGKIKQIENMTLDGFDLEKDQGERLKIKGTSNEPGNTQETYLMVQDDSSKTILGKTIDKSKFETITVVNTKTIPSNVIDNWDVSEKQDGSIMAWYIDENNNNLYELYIGGEGGVKANPDSSYLFGNFTNVTKMNLNNLDTSDVTIMYDMFRKCTSLTTLDLNKWNTSKLEDLFGMFQMCRNLTTLDISQWDTSNVIDMSCLFLSCDSLTTLNISQWNTSKVTNMQEMFHNCENLITLDISQWDTSEVTNMQEMFCWCNNLTTLNISQWNTSKVTNMQEMFYSCEKLETLDMRKSTFDNITDYNNMFNFCDNLLTIYVKDQSVQEFINDRLSEQGVIEVNVEIV